MKGSRMEVRRASGKLWWKSGQATERIVTDAVEERRSAGEKKGLRIK